MALRFALRPRGHAVGRVHEFGPRRLQALVPRQRRPHQTARHRPHDVRGPGPRGGVPGHGLAVRDGVHERGGARVDARRALVGPVEAAAVLRARGRGLRAAAVRGAHAEGPGLCAAGVPADDRDGGHQFGAELFGSVLCDRGDRASLAQCGAGVVNASAAHFAARG